MLSEIRKIIKNSAKCVHCGIEIQSNHGWDFQVHYCKVKPRQATKWEGEGKDAIIVPVEGTTTWNFAVDGGKNYIRRVGDLGSFIDTSEYVIE